MFLFCIIVVSLASTLSASSFYYDNEEPYFYEEALYYDNTPDTMMAGLESYQKRETGEETGNGGWGLPWKYEHDDFGSHECIIAKVCDFPGSGTDSGVTMEIYTNGTNRLCETDSLDYSYVNDWKTGRVAKYCGKFLGDCLTKRFEANFKVVLHMSNAIAHFFRQKDELCLDWIKHTQRNEATLTSISSGWSTETEGPDQIKTHFD